MRIAKNKDKRELRRIIDDIEEDLL